MKIAITSAGDTLSSQLDPRFGRSVFFIILDTETMNFKTIENSNTAAGGAGIGAAKLIIDSGAQAVLTGNCGPNAERTLSSANISLYTGLTGTVSQVVELFKNQKISPALGPNVESNFGMGI